MAQNNGRNSNSSSAMDLNSTKKRVRPKMDREARLRHQPDQARGYVKYSHYGREAIGHPAVFADVSASGMRLVSRFTNDVSVGDRLMLEFELPGDETKSNLEALVVRKVNDFEFAVTFQHREPGTRDDLRRAIERCRQYFNRSWIARKVPEAIDWAFAHKQGMFVAFVGALFLGYIGYAIFIRSDEHLGKPIRAWGPVQPKEWFLNYYKKDN